MEIEQPKENDEEFSLDSKLFASDIALRTIRKENDSSILKTIHDGVRLGLSYLNHRGKNVIEDLEGKNGTRNR